MNPKFFYIFIKTIVICIMCTKCDDKNDIIFKEEESIDILNYLTLTEQKYHA